MEDKVLNIHKFSGLNTRITPLAIGDQEMSSVINFDLGLSGELKKRTGVSQAAPYTAFGTFDTFTRANNGGVPGVTEDQGHAAWVATGGTWGPYQNEMYKTGSAADEHLTVPGSVDIEVEATVRGVGVMGVVARFVDNLNYVALIADITGAAIPLRLRSKVAGVVTEVNTSVTAVAGSKIKLTCLGGTLTATHNGVVVGTLAAAATANTRVGLYMFTPSTCGLDDFAAYKTLDAIQILGFFSTDTYKQFIARSGSELFWSTDALAWNLIAGGPWNAVECGIQYTDKFYMVRKVGTVIEWNGVTAVGIVNSPAGTFCRIFKDRLFVIHSEGAGAVSSRIYFSNALNLSSTGWPATNYVGVNEGDGDRLIALALVSDYLLVFKTRAIWNLFVQGSDTTSWILRPFRADTGCISRHSIVSREGVIFFCGLDGVYTTDGSDVKIISSPVGNYFDPITLDISTINQVSCFYWKDKYHLTLPAYASFPTWTSWSTSTWDQMSTTLWEAGSTSNIYLIYHTKNKGWTRWDFATTSPHRFTVVTSLASIKGVYAGERALTGRVLKYGDEIYTDLGATFAASFATKDFDLDKPTEKKRGKWIGVEAVGAGVYNFTSTIDRGAVSTSVSTVTTESEIKVKGPGFFRTWRFGLSITSGAPLSIYRINMYASTSPYRPIKISVA